MKDTTQQLPDATTYDVLVVGAGLWGCVVARELAEAGHRVLVIEARSLPGGNARSAFDPATGIECHCYGAHIFHTSDETVWKYINRFTTFTDYRHRVLTEYQGKVYSMPLGLTLINAFYNTNLKPAEVPAFIAEEVRKAGIEGEPKNLEEQAISLIGRPLYEAFIKGYTQKQWNTDPKDLPAFIIRRLPVRTNYNTDYFNDPYQGIPKEGYTALVGRLLEGADVRLGVDYLACREELNALADTVLYTGPIDAYYDYCYGALEYRSLRFEHEIPDTDNYQGVAVVNYNERQVPYTRIIEHKHFAFNKGEKTVITREYPADWTPGAEPYYPVNDEKNQALYERYRLLSEGESKVLFGGRLGQYRYYDMDKVVAAALALTKEIF
jgi:UDP-galactopyranose mutase